MNSTCTSLWRLCGKFKSIVQELWAWSLTRVIVRRLQLPTPTQGIVGIYVHCVSGNIPDQVENVVYCHVLEVLFNDTQLLR